jgi:transposase InsO family protein
MGQPRSTQRYRRRPPADTDAVLREEVRQLAGKHPRFGYRRIAMLLRRQGHRVNDKKVHRLWREMGLQVPVRRRRWRHAGSHQNACDRRVAQHPNDIWAYDFLSDQTTDGRSLKFLAIVDEFTREVLAIKVARSIRANDVCAALRELFQSDGTPTAIRSDNGSEFIADEVRSLLHEYSTAPLFIEPGAPWQNGYVESFNARFRDEVLDRELFGSVAEAQYLSDMHRNFYNQERPHSSLGGMTPAEFAASSI